MPKKSSGFGGFPAKTDGNTQIPNLFFSELLPQIDDLNELKITMYSFWGVQQREGDYRYLRLRDMLADEILLASLHADPKKAISALENALERAVNRGTLLHIQLGEDHLYFINTVRGRKAITALEQGDWHPGGADRPVALIVERPNIFTLYEQNIGPLTPMIGEMLRDAESTYPAEWITNAMKIGVESNKRSWRYVEAILKRWATEGYPNTPPRTESNGDEHPYLQDEYFKRREE